MRRAVCPATIVLAASDGTRVTARLDVMSRMARALCDAEAGDTVALPYDSETVREVVAFCERNKATKSDLPKNAEWATAMYVSRPSVLGGIAACAQRLEIEALARTCALEFSRVINTHTLREIEVHLGVEGA
jgi:hypothetical protein